MKRSDFAKEYRTWCRIRNRCNNKNMHNFAHYGGRGISVSQDWAKSFERFLEDMGRAPEGCSIERIDPNGNYEKSNCRWATAKEQQRNKRNTAWLVVNGERMSMADAAERHGLRLRTLWARLNVYGLDLERALSKPVSKKSRDSEQEAA